MLPRLLPMLATSAAPFDALDYSFEIKWDGIRALAAVEKGDWRLWGRGLADYTDRYPDLAVIRQLPAGTLVDGELVVFQKGVPDLRMLLRRHRNRCLVKEPWGQRRELLAEVMHGWPTPPLLLSEGVVGPGKAFYEAVVAQGHEGVMAKHLGAPYRPGRRSPAWKKIKPQGRHRY